MGHTNKSSHRLNYCEESQNSFNKRFAGNLNFFKAKSILINVGKSTCRCSGSD